ncbi:MAG: aminodeoxychorismate/anthranilate synthase component II [Spirochaetaceae bacterium]|nr:aminodeoxychorismate/anthranilate synthase component II [Spirochaetaceae bacterium]
MKKLLVIDNYDSFTFNLVQMFKQYNLDIQVYRNNKIDLALAEKINPDYILISPGPRTPEYSGISKPLIKKFYKTKPILGVCLGMQCINEVFEGKTVKAPVPVHGKKDKIYHEELGIFKRMPKPFQAARYHSLIAERESNELIETAHSKEGILMGIQHNKYPLYGIQFHPESFMTEEGYTIIGNFLQLGEEQE